jgi:hypothetical protein
MGENDDDEDEDDDDEGNVIAPSAPAPAAVPMEIIEEAPIEVVPEQEAPVVHEVILADVEPEPPQPCLFNMIMRLRGEPAKDGEWSA